jgi:hypothetical protein
MAMFCVVSCSEERVGLPASDGTPPSALTNVEVESQPGGAKITYTIPKETDISYVRGEYMYKGEKHIIRSSIYHNYLIVEGMAIVEPVDITLYVVDKSNNDSQPVVKSFTPGKPPIQTIQESLAMIPDFGGVNFSWVNEQKIEVGLTFFAADSVGKMDEVGIQYFSVAEGSYSIRGYDTKERRFGVSITDKWGNISDTVYTSLKPIYETLLNKSTWQEHFVPFDNTSVRSSRPFRYTWDNRLDGSYYWHTEFLDYPLPLMATLDMGYEAKLSRFKMWFRNIATQSYDENVPKDFRLYGCSSHVPVADAEWDAAKLGAQDYTNYWWKDWINDWELLGEYHIRKPSGSDKGVQTAEDYAFAEAGFDCNILLTSPKVRYLRFVFDVMGDSGNSININEFNFYGDDGSESSITP